MRDSFLRLVSAGLLCLLLGGGCGGDAATDTSPEPVYVSSEADLDWTVEEGGFRRPSRFDETDAPVLIVHGTDDAIVSIEEGEALRAYSEDSGVAHQFVPVAGAGHGAWDASVDGQNLRQLGEAFLFEHMDRVVSDID